MAPTTTTTLRIPMKLRPWLKVAADAENRNVNNLIVHVLTGWLREHYPDAEPE